MRGLGSNQWVIHLQRFQEGGGITDIEIIGQGVHIIIEAKRGWTLPSPSQLTKYVARFSAATNRPLIVTMSECSDVYAKQYLIKRVNGIPVRHLSWSQMSTLSNIRRGSHAEKRLMQELRNYLATIVSMQKQESNWVYIVSLGDQVCAPGLTFKNVVNDMRRYFHPYGTGGWPKAPPNYIAFRYDGHLQSIHHIENAQVIKNFHPHFPQYPNKVGEPHLLYDLGLAIRPQHKVKGGGIVRNARTWAMLDLLLTCETLSEARDLSNARSSRI